MAARDGSPAGLSGPPHFLTIEHAEEDTNYWQTMPATDGEDRWFWGTRLSPNTAGLGAVREYSVRLGAVSAQAAGAAVRVRLKGYTGLAHHSRIYVNGAAVDEAGWQGQSVFDHSAAIPAALIHEGDNVVRVEALDAGAAVDQFLVNWIEIEYWRGYAASDDQLAFGTPLAGRQQFALHGFTNVSLAVLDISDPANPTVIVNAAVQAEGSGYARRFADTPPPNARYFALSASRFRKPVSTTLDQPTFWRSPRNSADYIIITYDGFYDVASALAEHRRQQGLWTAVVKVSDVYDEFNWGIFNPQAIRDFLAYAYDKWARPAPAYVLLLGDAAQDYKHNRADSNPNYVPSHNMDSSLFGEVSSDNWFVTVSGNDPLPDMAVGRLPAQSADEARLMVAKTIQYEQQSPDPAWSTTALLVADDDESEFRQVTEQLASRLPYYYTPRRVYAANYPPGDAHADILNQLNAGSVLATYVGHGEFYAWGRWNGNRDWLFHASDVPRLTNADRLPFVIVGNCLNGFFASPRDNPALAESLLRKEGGGAVAVWAPSGLGYSSGHRLLLDNLYKAIFVGDAPTLGEATTAAKVATYAANSFWGELIATYILFGDPATPLRIPANFPYLLKTEPADGSAGVLLDAAIRITFSKPVKRETITLTGTTFAVDALSWNADATVLTVRHPDLLHAARYTVQVQGADAHGNALGPGLAPAAWSFTTTDDRTPPQVTLRLPADGATALPFTPISLTFSEPVRLESVTYALDPPAAGALEWLRPGLAAVFNHAQLTPGVAYTFTVRTARDQAGNPLAGPAQLSFAVFEGQHTYLPLVGR